MHDLAEAVHPGVGATRTVHPDRRVGYGRERRFKGCLYRENIEMGLRLPAAVTAAIVLDAAGYATARGQRVSRKRRAISQCGLAVRWPQL